MRQIEIDGQGFYQMPLTPWLSAVVLEEVTDIDWGASQMVMVTQLLRRVHKLAALLLIPEGMGAEEFYAKLDEPGWTAKREEFFKYHLGLLNAGRLVKDFLLVNDLAGVVALGQGIASEFTTLTNIEETSTNSSPQPVAATFAKDMQSEA